MCKTQSPWCAWDHVTHVGHTCVLLSRRPQWFLSSARTKRRTKSSCTEWRFFFSPVWNFLTGDRQSVRAGEGRSLPSLKLLSSLHICCTLLLRAMQMQIQIQIQGWAYQHQLVLQHSLQHTHLSFSAQIQNTKYWYITTTAASTSKLSRRCTFAVGYTNTKCSDSISCTLKFTVMWVPKFYSV